MHASFADRTYDKKVEEVWYQSYTQNPYLPAANCAGLILLSEVGEG